MKNIFFKTSLLITVFAVLISCSSKDEFTGNSTQVAASPTLSVELGFANEQTLIEEEAAYKFTVSISEKQISDISVKLTQTGGTAVQGVNFDFPSSVTIKKGTTSSSGFITILVDPRNNPTVDAIIEIVTGVEANIGASNSETVKFNILNLVEGDLTIGLEWAASSAPITDNFGNEIGATELADLRLLLTDVPFTEIIDGADGGSFETYTLTEDMPDGEYYIVADFYAAMDIPTDLNLRSTFNQVGVIDGDTYDFDNALNTAFICPANFFILNKIIKSGGTYVVESVGINNFDEKALNWTVGYDVLDAFNPAGWGSHISTQVDCDNDLIYGLNKEWMEGAWGEEIVREGNVSYTVDGAGNVTIESQYIFTTLYSGTEYDYTVSGNGTLDANGKLTINYWLDQDGFSPNGWMFDNGYMAQDFFIAEVSVE